MFTLTSLRLTSLFLKDKVYFLAYEELVRDPVRCLDKIQAWSGIDLTTVKNILINKVPFNAGHLVTGNRLRKQSNIYFQSKNDVNGSNICESNIALIFMEIWRKLNGF